MRSIFALIATVLLGAVALVVILTWATGCQKAVNVNVYDRYEEIDPGMVDRVHDTTVGGHLHFARDPQTDLCFAYSYIASQANDYSTGGPVVVLVPCDAVPKEKR